MLPPETVKMLQVEAANWNIYIYIWPFWICLWQVLTGTGVDRMINFCCSSEIESASWHTQIQFLNQFKKDLEEAYYLGLLLLYRECAASNLNFPSNFLRWSCMPLKNWLQCCHTCSAEMQNIPLHPIPGSIGMQLLTNLLQVFRTQHLLFNVNMRAEVSRKRVIVSALPDPAGPHTASQVMGFSATGHHLKAMGILPLTSTVLECLLRVHMRLAFCD